MSRTPLHYQWQWLLKSPPRALWPFIADTNRFNRDVGLPPVQPRDPSASRLPNARRRLHTRLLGLPLDWEEEPFEWVWPLRYGVVRRYQTGPIALVRGQVELEPTDTGGTRLTFHAWATPRNFLGRVIVPIQIRLKTAPLLKRVFPRYDQLAAGGDLFTAADPRRVHFPPGGRQRLASLIPALLDQHPDPAIIDNLIKTIETADDFALSRLRPYALADLWKTDRRATLETFLLATRIGLLEFQWNILCPSCRGPQASATGLQDISPTAHCPTCNIDFDVNFDRSTELLFRPVPAIRPVETRDFCIGGPQLTPHVIAQRLLQPAELWTITPTLEPGRYRLRALEQRGSQYLRVAGVTSQPDLPQEKQYKDDSDTPMDSQKIISDADAVSTRSELSRELTCAPTDAGWPTTEPLLSTSPVLHLENRTSSEQLLILERLAWTDQAATAADVIILQKFRDLFAAEALRPGQRISVGSLAILFTDLRASTELYRAIGDAPAFGRVMSHFDTLRAAIADEGGSMVKTIGDAVMAVFAQPIHALRAVQLAQEKLRNPSDGSQPLHLKAGLHYGPCIAVTLNDRLDYFGTTVNIAARLVDLSAGRDLIISQIVYQDPLIQEHISRSDPPLIAAAFEGSLKGHSETFTLWRIFR